MADNNISHLKKVRNVHPRVSDREIHTSFAMHGWQLEGTGALHSNMNNCSVKSLTPKEKFSCKYDIPIGFKRYFLPLKLEKFRLSKGQHLFCRSNYAVRAQHIARYGEPLRLNGSRIRYIGSSIIRAVDEKLWVVHSRLHILFQATFVSLRVFAYVAGDEVGQGRGRGAVVSQVLMSFYVFTNKIIIDLIIS